MPVSAEELFRYHERPGAFFRLIPPWIQAEILHQEGGISDGAVLEFKLYKGPIPVRWRARHCDCRPGRSFVDVQEVGPFRQWRHEHRMVPQDDETSILRDEIRFTPPLGPIGALFGTHLIYRDLEKTFRLRHFRTFHDLDRHAAYATEPMTIVIAGRATRLVRAMAAFLSLGGHHLYHMEPTPDTGVSPYRFRPFFGEGTRYPLEDTSVLIHTGIPYATSDSGGDPFAYLDHLAKTLSVSGNHGVRLIELSGFHPSMDRFVTDPALDFSEFGPVDPEATAEDPLPRLDSVVESHVRLHLGSVITRSMHQLTELLLRLESFVFLRNGAKTPQFHWISQEDALGALLYVLHHPSIEGDVALIAPTSATRAQLQQLLIEREFAGYTTHRILKVLPWTGPGMPQGVNARLNSYPTIGDLGFSFLAPNLARALEVEAGE
ncbi:hypothetical protein SCOR_10635 [Sulfidibacter corallicola]|uniref:Coenzyme Q-binding protein COQ10 START domain-containing protein n=1 Tax=Sulfidibacter corallicola TaxID=2818388 RepID=A0A8A4TF92_SULCO|nr:SRPBCC family protein [Sulfidibacter corallicola]QTD48210.1 hypothetical protein J3U87_21705 [Sulfidibacter corallicola]